MEFKDTVKVALRIAPDVTIYDSEIFGLIEAAKIELEESNIDVSIDDELIRTAIIMFVKSHFGYDNTDSEKQLRAFRAIQRKLALEGRWTP